MGNQETLKVLDVEPDHAPARKPRVLARIDDTLVQQFHLRERLENLLLAVPDGRKPGRAIQQRLKQEVLAHLPDSASIAIDLYLEQNSTSRRQALRLVLLPVPAVSEITVRLLEDPQLPIEKKKLLRQLLPRACAGATSSIDPPLQLLYTPTELLDAFLEAAAAAGAEEPETYGLVWLRGFRELEAGPRAQLIEGLAARRRNEFIAILQVEACNPDVSVRRAVASSLQYFTCNEALDLAAELQWDPDPIVRHDAARAESSLLTLPQLVSTGPCVFHRGFCLAAPSVGLAGVLYSVHAAGGLKFTSMLLDTWHRGVVDAWGNTGVQEERFGELVLAFASEVSHFAATGEAWRSAATFESISQDEASDLIRNCASLTVRRRRKLPAEFPLWHRLLQAASDGKPGPESGSLTCEFVFDLHCSGCGKPIAANRLRSNVCTTSHGAYCHRCTPPASRSRSRRRV